MKFKILEWNDQSGSEFGFEDFDSEDLCRAHLVDLGTLSNKIYTAETLLEDSTIKVIHAQ